MTIRPFWPTRFGSCAREHEAIGAALGDDADLAREALDMTPTCL